MGWLESDTYPMARSALNALLDKFSRRLRLGHAFSPPRKVDIEHTTRCNLSCLTCARSRWPGDFHDMDDVLADRVRREVIPIVGDVGLSGFGEPLLGRHFAALFDQAVAFGKRPGLITNGVLLDEAWMTRFVGAGAMLILSIDGATNKTMRALRGVALDPLLAKMDRLAELRRKQPDTGFQLHVSFVLLRRNIAELPSLIALLAQRGVDRLIVMNPCLAGREEEVAGLVLRRGPDLARRLWPRIRQAAQDAHLDVELPKFDWLDEAEITPRTRPPADLGQKQTSEAVPQGTAPAAAPAGNAAQRCYGPWFDAFITVDGDVRGCCFGSATSLGSLRRDSFAAVWNGPAFRHLRRTVNTDHAPEYCRHCPLRWGRNAGDELRDEGVSPNPAA